MRLHDELAPYRDKYAILTFHEESVKDFAELDEKLPVIIRERWDGKSLPFPILLDSTGETIKNWGVNAFPTTVLIDPQGKLVGEVDEEQLYEKVTGKKR